MIKNFYLILTTFSKTAETAASNEDTEGENLFQFRDGEEHIGQANFQDISDGFNDGELSDNCLVFVVEEDEWQPVEKFLTRRKKAKCNLEKGSADEVMVDANEAQGSSVVNSLTSNMHTEIHGRREAKFNDSSREKKKPSRDSSSWGKSAPVNMIQVAPSTSKPTNSTMQIDSSNPTGDKGQPNRKHQKTSKSNRKKGNIHHVKPTPKLMRYIIQAIMQFEMIEEGDRLLLGLSGGKDSLTLLHCRKFDLFV